MAKLKHSKLKNTQILFELLTRQVAADTIRGTETSPALRLIQKYYKPGTVLSKELGLYESLSRQKYKSESKAETLLREVLKARRALDAKRLADTKYELVKEIKSNYNLDAFTRTQLPDYKLYASIYSLFESDTKAKLTPEQAVNCRFSIIEHISGKAAKKPQMLEESGAIAEYKKETEEVRLLAYRLMIENFNKKYSKLTAQQKTLLREYINNVSNSDTMKNILITNAKAVRQNITKLIPKVADKVTVIKLKEIYKLTKKYDDVRLVNENHVLAMLMYMELIKELKKC